MKDISSALIIFPCVSNSCPSHTMAIYQHSDEVLVLVDSQMPIDSVDDEDRKKFNKEKGLNLDMDQYVLEEVICRHLVQVINNYWAHVQAHGTGEELKHHGAIFQLFLNGKHWQLHVTFGQGPFDKESIKAEFVKKIISLGDTMIEEGDHCIEVEVEDRDMPEIIKIPTQMEGG